MPKTETQEGKVTETTSLASIAEIQARVRNHLKTTYRKSAIARATGVLDESYPKQLPISHMSQRDTTRNVTEARRWANAMTEFAEQNGLSIKAKTWHVPAKINMPTHVIVPSLEVATAITRHRWPNEANTERHLEERLAHIRKTFGENALLRVIDDGASRLEQLTQTDFELVCDVARYAQDHDIDGLTPRQVPLAGLSAKWLEKKTRLSVIRSITGKAIDLAERPRQIDFAYLDPDYLATEGRRFDSRVEGDLSRPAYVPTTVIIVENIDCMRFWPTEIEGAICVFGAGHAAAKTLVNVGWIRQCPNILYWGDLDCDGFQILDEVRASGIDAASIGMGRKEYYAYEKFGTDLSPNGAFLRSLDSRQMRLKQETLTHLTDEELKVWRLCAAEGSVRRIEQERMLFPEIGR